MNLILLFFVIFYCFALWLGLYLAQRDWHKDYPRMAGLGLVSYALALGFRSLALITEGISASPFHTLHQLLIYQPAIFWAGGLLHLLPEESKARRLIPFYYYGQILATELLIVFNLADGFPDWALALVVGLPVFIYLAILVREQARFKTPSRLTLALVGTIFFGLSVGLFLPFDFVPQLWVLLAIGFDLFLLGLGIAIHAAYQEGHDYRRSMWHGLQNALFISLLIGGQVLLAILGIGMNVVMLSLLLGLLTTGICVVVFAPNLRSNREAQAIETSEQNADPDIDFSTLSDADYVRYTRRALSYLDDLPKLASSPLARLPLIDARLSSRNAYIDTLARANELKQLLTESIDRLKPKSDLPFGSTDDWRYYNAVYFPYVAGIKPSRRRQTKEGLASHEIEALEWFRRDVPERTLHNWQKKAAQLIALSLRENLEP